MNKTKIGLSVRAAVGVAVLLAVATSTRSAKADLSVLNFGFQNLASTFESTGADTGQFTAISSATLLAFPTLGNVTRTVEPEGYAQFNWAASNISVADVNLTLNLTNINQGTQSADATGSIAIMDINGYEIVGSVTGTWSLDNHGLAHFDGTAFDLTFDTNGDPVDSLFEGTDVLSPGFSMDFSQFEQVLGSLVDLSSVPGDGFFLDSWTDDNGQIYVDSGLDTLLIPAPGALLLGAMGLGLVGWVKRKFA